MSTTESLGSSTSSNNNNRWDVLPHRREKLFLGSGATVFGRGNLSCRTSDRRKYWENSNVRTTELSTEKYYFGQNYIICKTTFESLHVTPGNDAKTMPCFPRFPTHEPTPQCNSGLLLMLASEKQRTFFVAWMKSNNAIGYSN